MTKFKLLYLGPDGADAAVRRRVNGLRSVGAEVVAMTFFRGVGKVPPDSLGRVSDGNLGQRVIAVLCAVSAVFRNLQAKENVTHIYARNLDLLLIAIFFKMRNCRQGQLRVFYEVLDIHPSLSGTGAKAHFMRLIERIALRYVDGIIVSSIGFIREYFAPIQGYKKGHFLIENKLDLRDFPKTLNKQAALPGNSITIGFFGKFRCRKSLAILAELARNNPERIRVKLAGIFPDDFKQEFEDIIALPNVTFLGGFSYPQDLPELYSDVDLNWVVDLSSKVNAKILIPNRLYEGGAFNVVPITERGTYADMRAKEIGVACSLIDPVETSINSLLLPSFIDVLLEARSALASVPIENFVVSDDYSRLLAYLKGERGSSGGFVA